MNTSIVESVICRKCKYDLRGLDYFGKCPECGERIDIYGHYKGIERFTYNRNARLINLLVICLIPPFVGISASALGYALNFPTWMIASCTAIALVCAPLYYIVYWRHFRSMAVTLNWDDSTVIFEHLYRPASFGYTKPALARFECRMDEILRVDHFGGALSQIRVSTPHGMAIIYSYAIDFHKLYSRLSWIASNTPDIPINRRWWLTSVIAIIAVIAAGAATVFVMSRL